MFRFLFESSPSIIKRSVFILEIEADIGRIDYIKQLHTK